MEKEREKEIDKFLGLITEDDLGYLMYKLCKRCIIPQYYLKYHIDLQLLENYEESRIGRQYKREKSLYQVLETGEDPLNKIFDDLMTHIDENIDRVDETLQGIIWGFVQLHE